MTIKVEPREGTEGNSNWSAGALVPPVPPPCSSSGERFPSWFPLFHLFPVREDGPQSKLKTSLTLAVSGRVCRATAEYPSKRFSAECARLKLIAPMQQKFWAQAFPMAPAITRPRNAP